MSVQLDGSTEWYTYSTPPAGSFTMCGWFRRDTDSGAEEGVVGITANSFFEWQGLIIIQGGDVIVVQDPGGSASTGITETTGTWRFFMLRYDTGAAVVDLKMCVNGASSSFTATAQRTSTTNATPTDLVIGAREPDGDAKFAGTFAFVKLFDSVLTDGDALAERLYRNPQQASYAAYKFASGALTTDSSGNSRTLTSNGTPVHSTDEPSDILGDDPAASSTVGAGINKGLVNRGLINSGLIN